jgi:hypothetical protein
MAKKSNYMVTVTSTYTKTENWLVENETKEDAKHIAENLNQSPLYKCFLFSKEESSGDYDEAIVKEVSFKKTITGKYFYLKEIEGNKK